MSFRKIRITILLAALVAVGAWGLRTTLRRNARTEWKRPLRLAVVLLGDGDLDRWTAGGERLEKWLHDEFVRWRQEERTPVRVRVHGPVRVDRVPDFEPHDEDFVERARHAWQLSRQLSRIDAAAKVGRSEVRIYVALQQSRVSSVEGLGAEGGEVGLVRATAGDDPDFALAAVAHELFHCLGASDKYDAAGHALPSGLVDPARGYPQSFAEIMVGEIPLAPRKGRVPDHLDEVRVGEATARELKWIR